MYEIFRFFSLPESNIESPRSVRPQPERNDDEDIKNNCPEFGEDIDIFASQSDPVEREKITERPEPGRGEVRQSGHDGQVEKRSTGRKWPRRKKIKISDQDKLNNPKYWQMNAKKKK